MNILFRPVSWTCRCCSVLMQQTRSTVMVHRMYPVPVPKGFFPRLDLKKREKILVFDENTNSKPQGDIQLLLLADIEGIGSCGQIAIVPKRYAWHDLLVSGAAVYITEENMKKYQELIDTVRDAPRQTPTGRRTIRELQSMTLPIPMSALNPWVLNENHIRIAFRKVGVYLSNSNITLPKDPVTGPGELEITVSVNKLDQVRVRAIIYHYNAKRPELMPVIQAWPTIADSVPVGTILSPIYSAETKDFFLSSFKTNSTKTLEQ